MSYWNDFDINELIIIKEKLVDICNELEIKLNIFTCIIDDISNSIEGRKV